MTIAIAGGASRASSARPPSVNRTLAKRRTDKPFQVDKAKLDKPYKTEQNRVLEKRKKLNTHTTFKQAPAGFSFLPVGTMDLAKRCKELSRQRGIPTYIVNAKPRTAEQEDPQKVSYHTHRIGYHFRSEVVDDACQELGYTFYRGSFVKEADLANFDQQSKMARVMAKHGLQNNRPNQSETDDQIRAAIKELFPRIPQEDLKEILRHAWKKGSKRVGTMGHELNLPRRVQLAVGARIRHTYTDYDRLLKALGWAPARRLVEPYCLKKLIEWRGENEQDDDDELEEVIRETIIIDDDDDEDDGPETIVIDSDDDEPILIESDDDEGNASHGASNGVTKTGYNRDTSLEISHRLAADEDFAAESQDEHSKDFFKRYNLRPRNLQDRNLDLREKIFAARESIRAERESFVQPEIIRVHVPENSDGIIEVGGQQYRQVPSQNHGPMPLPMPSPYYPTRQPPPPPPSTHARAYASQPEEVLIRSNNSPGISAGGFAAFDRPVPSIEPQDDLRRVAMTSAAERTSRSRPATPESVTSEKRRRLDYFPPQSPAQKKNAADKYFGLPRDRDWGDVGRLTHPSNESPNRAPLTPAFNGKVLEQDYGSSATDAPPYDPRKPLLHLEDYRGHPDGNTARLGPYPERDYRPGFVDAQVAPIQYMQHPQRPLHHGSQYISPGHARPQVIYVQTPEPMHGAPAAIQQVPRDAGATQPGTPTVYQQYPVPQAGYQQPHHGSPAQPPQFHCPR